MFKVALQTHLGTIHHWSLGDTRTSSDHWSKLKEFNTHLLVGCFLSFNWQKLLFMWWGGGRGACHIPRKTRRKKKHWGAHHCEFFSKNQPFSIRLASKAPKNVSFTKLDLNGPTTCSLALEFLRSTREWSPSRSGWRFSYFFPHQKLQHLGVS